MPPKSRSSRSSGSLQKQKEAMIIKDLNQPSHLVSSVIGIIILGIFLVYVLDLERFQCFCSDSFKRDYIKYYTGALIALRLFLMARPEFNLTIVRNPMLLGLLGMLNVAFIVIIVMYVKELKDAECECSENWKRTLMEFYGYVAIVMVGLLTLMMIMIVMGGKLRGMKRV